MGDCNLNLINHHCHKASLIDNIFTNNPLCPAINGLFFNDISDHLPIFSLVLNNHSIGNNDKYVIFREKNAHSLNAFKDDLAKINWAE